MALVYLRRSFGKIRLAGFGIHPLLLETTKEEREAQVIGLINSFISKHQARKERVSISLPRENVVLRFIKFPAATKENLRKVLEYETSRLTPFEKGETYADYQVLKEEKERLHLLVAFAKKADVDYYLTLLKKVGMTPLSIQVSSVAALNLFCYHEEPRNGAPTILLDVAEPFLELNLLQRGEWTESIRLPLPSEDRASKIVSLLNRMGLKEDSVSKSSILVYGPGGDEAFSSSLKTLPSIRQVFSPPLHRLDIGKEAPNPGRVYSSIGLPLQGLTRTRFHLNLLPMEMRKKVRQFGKPLFLVLTLIAFVLCVSWGVGAYQQHKGAWETVSGEIKKRKPEVDAVEKLQKQKEGLAKEVAEFGKIEAGEQSKIDVLRELAQILPGTVWIWNLKYNGKEVEISGRTLRTYDMSLLSPSRGGNISTFLDWAHRYGHTVQARKGE